MTKRLVKITMVSVSALAIIFSLQGCTKNEKERVTVKGSTTVLPITQKTAEAFRKSNQKIAISIEGSGSGNGIKALIDGSCDIANSSREMKDEETADANKRGIRVKEVAVAYDMIVPVVNPENPVSNLSTTQLKAIYDGSVKNWKELGGKDEKIVVISRDTSSGTYEIWEKIVMNKADIRKDALLQASNGAIVSAVSANKKAIGYVGYGYISNTVKPIQVNGIDGTIENGKSRKFPISRKLYMYLNENKISSSTQSYIDFVLSEKGQKLVKEAGFIPL